MCIVYICTWLFAQLATLPELINKEASRIFAGRRWYWLARAIVLLATIFITCDISYMYYSYANTYLAIIPR